MYNMGKKSSPYCIVVKSLNETIPTIVIYDFRLVTSNILKHSDEPIDRIFQDEKTHHFAFASKNTESYS